MNFKANYFLTIAMVILAGWNLSRIFSDRDDPIRDSPSRISKGKPLIIPNESFFGISVGTPEDEVLTEQGPPTGYVILNAQSNAAIYGSSKAFIFTKGKLSGIRIGYSLIESSLPESFGNTDVYRGNQEWAFPNGITYGTSLEKIRKVVGERLTSDWLGPNSRYRQKYQDGKST
ncbi:MAG: hypothetical protein ACJA16_003028, partial [Akkermansiaceae bacterium]